MCFGHFSYFLYFCLALIYFYSNFSTSNYLFQLVANTLHFFYYLSFYLINYILFKPYFNYQNLFLIIVGFLKINNL